MARGAVVLAVALFGALALYHVRLPGVAAGEAAAVLPAMQLLQGAPLSPGLGVAVHLLGRAVPVMLADGGVASTYAVVPLVWLLGVDVLAVRLGPILAGMLAVLLTYHAGRRIYDRWVGVGAALLLAVFPAYLFWTRVGLAASTHLVPLALGIALAYLAWRGQGVPGGTRWLFLAGLLVGLALATRLLFVWALLALPAAYLILLVADWLSEDRHAAYSARDTVELALDRLHRDLPLRGPREALAPLAGLLLGAVPVLAYAVVSRGSGRALREHLFPPDRGDGAAGWESVQAAAEGSRALLRGSSLGFTGGVADNPLYPWVLGLSALGLLILVHRVPPLRRCRRSTVFLLGFAVVTAALSGVTGPSLAPTHLLLVLPIPQLTVAGFAAFGARWLAPRLRARLRPALTTAAVVALLVAPLIARDLWLDVRYHRALARTGGRGDFSSAIYDLAAYLDAHGVTRPYALDPGLPWRVMLLTEGRVAPVAITDAPSAPGADDAALREALTAPDPVFLVRGEDGRAALRLTPLEQVVAASGRTLRLEQAFTQRDGTPVYFLFRVRP
ncbi:MAG: glycosyltransferase family 39 protein [Sphaerobacter sp.]|nr:glycosyltransferase family 39 protein [Sphaerobacter sp.]